jgi:hypothetical protein
MNLKLKLKQFLTLKEEQLKNLNKLLLLLSVCGVFFGNYVANYFGKDSDTCWVYYASILICSFLLLLIALKKEINNLIGGTWYKIIVYILINNFIDRYFGITGWSWNDYITIVAVVLEYLIYKKIISKYK